MLTNYSVLNPSNQTAMPIPTATTQAVAFAGVSSATNVPFTSGIVATTTAPSASTSTAGANSGIQSGVVGMVGAAALFGMVAAGL
jgi:transforming growth factor-beta-induced protein